MAGELEKALANKIGDNDSDSELLEAMRSLIILLLKRLDKQTTTEEDSLANDLTNRINEKYSKQSQLHYLIPCPM